MKAFATVIIVMVVLLPEIGCSAFSHAPFVHSSSSDGCAPGPPIAVPGGRLRPTPTATCSYTLKDLRSRIMQLMDGDASSLSAESLEKLFSIPPLTTEYDDPRDASYAVQISGADGWSLSLWITESFFPTNKGPDKFVPGLRPKRLDSFQNSTARVELFLKVPRNGSPCPNEPFLSAANRAGWKNVTTRAYVTDGGHAFPTFLSPDEGRILTQMPLQLSPDICSTNLTFSKEPLGHKPIGMLLP
jgi:hypothetical protein